MDVETLQSLIKSNNQDGLAEFLNKNNLLKIGYNDLCPNFEDCDILEDLLKNGHKDMAKMCIDAGFRVVQQNLDRNSESLMHLAVMLGSPEIVQSLLDKRASITHINCNQQTPLILAAICGNNQIINMILSHVDSKNCSNQENFSHFHIACMQNKVDRVKSFLIFGTDINEVVKEDSLFNPGFTALHFAVQACSIETVEFLVNNGADITVQEKRGLTPLHFAFRMRNKQMINSLLSVQHYFVSNPIDRTNLSHFHIACAMNNLGIVKDFVEKKLALGHEIPYEAHNWSHNNALSFAIKNECIDVVKYLITNDRLVKWKDVTNILSCTYLKGNVEIIHLIKSKIEKDIMNSECRKPLESSKYPVRKKFKPDFKANCNDDSKFFKRLELSQYTELHLAVIQKNQQKITSILMSFHPSIVVAQDARGKTPLHLAFESQESENQKKVMRSMLQLNLKLNVNPVDRNGLSHFHIACTIDNPNIVKNLIYKKRLNVNVPVKMDSPIYAGWTSLHFAVASRNSEVVQLLLNNCADYIAKNAAGLSSYDLAIPGNTKFLIRNADDGKNEWKFIEQILLADKCIERPNFNSRGITFLHIACAVNDIKQVHKLAITDALNQVIDADVNMWKGYTPLHIAVHYNNSKVIKVLLDNNADVSIQNVNKRTPADCVFDDINVDRRLYFSSENICNLDGLSQLHLACNEDPDVSAVQHLLNLGADVNKPINFNSAVTDAGKTPLHFAVSRDNHEIVKLLLANGADVHARDCYLNTPLHECKSLTIFQLLTNHGADVHACNSELSSALASMLWHCEDVNLLNTLFECGLDVNEQSRCNVGSFYWKNPNRSCLILITKHIRRLLILGMQMSEVIMNNFNLLKLRLYPEYEDYDFQGKCIKELVSIKKMQINNCTTLYDLLLKDPSSMVKYFNNETLKKIMQSLTDLKTNYPIYSYLLILQYKRGMERKSLLFEAKKSLSILLKSSLPDDEMYHILQFFNNRELKYLNQAVTLR